MGLEELNSVLNHFAILYGSSSNIAKIFAWIGIILVAIVLLYYISVGFVRLTKAFLGMRVKYLGIVLLALGAVFITLSIVIP